MKKAITKFLSIMLLFIIITGTLPENIYAVIEAPKQFNELDAQVAEMEDKIGKVEGSDSRFEPSAELISYANKKIDVANPTKILDYSDKTANFLPSADEAKEYFIKAVTEGQAGMVLYGDKDFAKNTIEEVVYSASYGIYLKHLKDWKIESQLIDPTNDIYRHLVLFQHNVPKSHTIELEERIDTVASWILSEYKNVNIPEEMIIKNNLDEEGVADLQKAMLIHDYVIKNVRPYYGNLTFFGKYKSERHSLNSAMFEGETVCQGFFLLFSRLADRVELETRAVRGYKGFIDVDKKNDASKRRYIYYMDAAVKAAKKGGRWGMNEISFGANHGWNQVKIGDNWYHADMSGDSSYTNIKHGESWPQPQALYYKYFLKTDKEFKEPVNIRTVGEDDKIIDIKQFLVWQGNENYDTPEEPFLWTYDILYDFKLNEGINSTPYLQNKFTKNYPMGNSWNDKGKFTFEEKDLSYVPETRYEMTIPGYENGAAPVKIKKGLQTPEEAFEFAAVSGVMFKDGNRTGEGYVDFGTLKLIEVKHDNPEEASEFDRIKDKIGEKVTLTAYFEAEGKRYEERVEFEVAPDSAFKSSTDLRLKDGAEDMITVPQHVHIKNNNIENKRLRDEKIAEIDREILSRVEAVKDGNSVPVEEYSGEKKLIWKDAEFNNDNVPIGEPTREGNYLVRTILLKGEDGRWTSLDFKVNLTEVEKTTTTIIECDVDYIEKKASDRTGLIVPRTGREIGDGGDLERFFRYRNHPIKMEWINSIGLTMQRLNTEIYVLDEDGNPQYRTQKYYNGILMEKDSNGQYTVKTEKTLNKMFSTPGLYKFRVTVWNDEDGIKVSKDFSVKVLSDEEIPVLNKYIIKFDANGHGEAPKDVEIEEGAMVEKPEDLVAEGWKFEGWYADKAGNTEFDFHKLIKENTVIYAKWVKVEEESEPSAVSEYTVTFDSNGHGIAPAAQIVEDGKRAAEPAALEEEGWVFGGWYAEAECINMYDFGTSVIGNITLFAKWTENGSGNSSSSDDIGVASPSDYTVSFDNNGHGTAPEVQTVESGAKATKPFDPSESGYTFGGWYEEADCINVYDFEAPITGNITLFAKWTKNSSGSGSLSGGGSHGSGASGGSRSRGGGSRGALSAGKVAAVSEQRSGIWMQGAKGWWYQYNNGAYPKNEWKLISWNGAKVWYAFDEAGYMRTGWFLSGGNWYYLNPAGGAMCTGWVEINGKWYYLEPSGNANHPQGVMYMNEKTPDGYTVDANGAWIK